MGIFGSKEPEPKQMEAAVKTEQQKKMTAEDKKRREEESKKKEEIEKKHAAELAEIKKQDDEELATEKEKNLEETKRKVQNFNETKMKLSEKIDSLQKEIDKNIRKQIELTKESGLKQVTEDKNQLREEKEKLVEMKELVVNEMKRLEETQENMLAERLEMAQQKEKEGIEKLEKHHQDLENLNAERNSVVKEGENEKTRLAMEHREFQNKIKHQKEQLCEVQMKNTYELSQIQLKSQQIGDFKRNGKGLIKSFSSFKSHFGQQEGSIITTREDIEDQMKLSCPPELSEVLLALRNLDEEVQHFDLRGSNNEDFYSDLRQEVMTLVEKLLTVLDEIQSRIGRYQTSWATSSTSSPPAQNKVQLMDFEKEGFHFLGSTKNTPPSSEKDFPTQKPRTMKDNKNSIVELNKEAKDLISKLSKEMLKFHVPEPTTFDDTLALQFQELTVSHSRILNQITNGPSTSSAHSQVTSGATDVPSTNTAKPAIQQIEEPEDETEQKE